ncbi:hypothetical protein HY605_03270 [Candidatus Peregrinibacteria bacterium]|nr:hypothetical protein [Candidatus Peregrinibacteria bacterium]
MKNTIKVMMLVVMATTFVACSKAVTKTVSYEKATAKTAFADVEPFAKETFPEAILVGFNNYDLTFDRTNLYPLEEDRDTSAETPFWAFMFARSAEDIADGTLSDDEAFAVIFNAGELKLVDVGVVVTRDIEVPSDLSSDKWTADTDDVLKGVLAEIEAQGYEPPVIEHVDFNMNTTWDEPYGYEVTVWTSSTAGYDSKVNGETGEVGYTRAIEVF